MAINWSEYIQILNTYREELRNIVPYLSAVWNRFQAACPAEYQVSGRQVQVPLVLSQGHGFRAEGIPTIDSPALNSAYFNFVEFFIGEEFDTKVFDSENASNVKYLLISRLDSRILELKSHFERMLFGDGYGKIAKIANVANAPTYGVAPCFVRDISAYANDATKYARVGMYVDVVAPNGTVRGSSKIVAVNAAGKTITLENPVPGAAVNDFIVVSGSWGNEFVGLAGITDNSLPYGGIDPATYPFWKAYVYSGTAGNDVVLSMKFLVSFISALKSHMGATYAINLAVTTPNVLGVLMETMKEFVRIPLQAGDTISVGFRGCVLVHPDLPNGYCEVISSDYCNEGTIYFVDTSQFKYAWVKQFSWEELGGSPFIPKFVVGQKCYQVMGRTSFAFYCMNRRAVGAIKDIKIV